MKKTILVISSEPTNLIPLRTGNERKEIKAVANNQSNHVHFDIREENAVTFDDLMHAFEEHKPNIIHFIGHGKGEDGLCLQNDDNKEQLVKNDILEELFERYSDYIELVVLNACYSSIQAKHIIRHIPYVIGMDKKILDKTAIKFSKVFYAALSRGADIAVAYQNAKLSIKNSELAGYNIIQLHTTQDLPPPPPTLQDPLLVIPPSSHNRVLLADKHFIEVHDALESHWKIDSPRRITNKAMLRHELSMVQTNFIYIYAQVIEKGHHIELQLGEQDSSLLSLNELADYLEQTNISQGTDKQKPILFLILFGKVKKEWETIIPNALHEQSAFIWVLNLPSQKGGLELLSDLTCQAINTLSKQPNLKDTLTSLDDFRFRINSQMFGDSNVCLDVSSDLEKQFRAALLRLMLGRDDIKRAVSDSLREHADHTNKLLLYTTTGNHHSCIFELPQQIKYHAKPGIKSEGIYIKNIPIHIHLEPELDEDDILDLFYHALAQCLPQRGMSISEAIPVLIEKQNIKQNNSAIAFNWNISASDDNKVGIGTFKTCLELWIEQLTNSCHKLFNENICVLHTLLVQVPENIEISIAELHEELQDELSSLTSDKKMLETLSLDQPLTALKARDIDKFFSQSKTKQWKEHFGFEHYDVNQRDFSKWVCKATKGEFERVVTTLWQSRQNDYQDFKREQNA